MTRTTTARLRSFAPFIDGCSLAMMAWWQVHQSRGQWTA